MVSASYILKILLQTDSSYFNKMVLWITVVEIKLGLQCERENLDVNKVYFVK